MKSLSLGSVMLGLLLSSVAFAAPAGQPTESRDEVRWGEAVEGVQLSLRADKDAWYAYVGEAPTLALKVRNNGKEPVHFVGDPSAWELRIDGRWYSHRKRVQAEPAELAPGQETWEMPIHLTTDWQDDDTNEPLRVSSGKHIFVVALSGSTDEGAKKFRVVSNSLVAVPVGKPLPGSQRNIGEVVKNRRFRFAAVCEAEEDYRGDPDEYLNQFQDFKLVKLLAGKAPREDKLKLGYRAARSANEFERAAGKGERVIVIVHLYGSDEDGELVKALPDTPENREAVIEVAQRRVSVRGRVLTEPGGEAVVGATVLLWRHDDRNRKTITTGSDGAYVFPDVPPGEHTLWIADAPNLPPGMASDGVMIEVGAEDILAGEFCLKLPQSISGTVRDDRTGEPVPQAEIEWLADEAKVPRTVIADARGCYVLYVRPYVIGGEVTLGSRGTPDRYYPAYKQRKVKVEIGQHVADVDLQVACAPKLSGRVVLPDGEPAGEIPLRVEVHWLRSFGEAIQRLDSARRRWRGREEEGTHTHDMRGHLRHTHRETDYIGAGRGFRIRTDPQGRFMCYMKRPELYCDFDEAVDITVLTRLPDYSMAGLKVIKTTTMDPVPDPVQITLTPTGSTEFTVVGPDGKPISGAEPGAGNFLGHAYYAVAMPEAAPQFKALDQGRFRATGLVPGLGYQFSAGAEDYARTRGMCIIVEPGEEVNAGTLRLPLGDKDTPPQEQAEPAWGEPVEGLRCRWVEPGGPITVGTIPVVSVEVENVSSSPIFWDCGISPGWPISWPNKSIHHAPVQPEFDLQLGPGVRLVTVREAREKFRVGGGTKDSDLWNGYCRLSPGGRLRLTAMWPFWRLDEPGQVRIETAVHRYGEEPIDETWPTCPPLVLNVIGEARPGAKQEEPPWGEVSNGLQCRLLPATQTLELAEGQERVEIGGCLRYELRNVGDKVVTFLPWGTPLTRYLLSGGLTVIDPNGQELEYKVLDVSPMLEKRSYLSIAPGQTICDVFPLIKEHAWWGTFDFTQVGEYQITATLTRKPPRHEMLVYYDEDAEKAKENPDNLWTGVLKSNTVKVVVVRAVAPAG